jgi:hypothetical protein
MLMSGRWDEANGERRKRIKDSRMKTARNFNLRIRQFLNKDILPNFSLTEKEKEEIIHEIFKDLITEK